MAILNVKFDTKDKTLTITKDGTILNNVMKIEFVRNFDQSEFFAEITAVEENQEEGVVIVTRVSADDTITPKLSNALFNRPGK